VPNFNETTSHFNQRRGLVWLTILILATFAVYLGVGLYYVTGTISPFHTLKLTSVGDEFLGAYPGWNNREEFDDAAYNRAAVEILNTGIPRDHTGSVFLYAPVYAYFVAACYSVGGIRLLAIVIPQAIAAALTCGFVMRATNRISGRDDSVAGLIAGFLFLINLRLAMYVGYISPTILLMFFFSMAFWAASSLTGRGRLAILVTSLLLAAGTQSGFFFVALTVGFWLVIRFFRTRSSNFLLAAAIIVLFAGAKVFLPKISHQNAKGSVSEIGQAVLWEANNPFYETMGLFSLWERRPGNPWTNWKMSPAEQQKYEEYLERTNHHPVQSALLWIRENPAQYAKLAFIRLWTTLGPFTGMMSARNKLISLGIWLLTFPAGIYGWWLLRKSDASGFSIAVAVSILISSTFVIVEWYLRYRFPVDLLAIAYSGIAYSALIGSFRLSQDKSKTG
jgi:hypothetical protein